MLHGKVKEWTMTEEQRLAYIKKHPIKETKKPKGASLTKVTDKQRKKAIDNKLKTNGRGMKIIDTVDKDKLHKMFIAGEKLDYIAKVLNITTATLNNFIKGQRKINPEKWPHRVNRKK